MRTEQLLPALEVWKRLVTAVELGQRLADVVVRVGLVGSVAVAQRWERLLGELECALPFAVVERRGRLILKRAGLSHRETARGRRPRLGLRCRRCGDRDALRLALRRDGSDDRRRRSRARLLVAVTVAGRRDQRRDHEPGPDQCNERDHDRQRPASRPSRDRVEHGGAR
jgi:hypothetical protein